MKEHACVLFLKCKVIRLFATIFFSTFHEGAKEYESETVLKRKKF